MGAECHKCHKDVEQGCTTFGCPMRTPDHDPINAPSHYRAGDTYETIRVIEAWKLNYNLGNTVKYISRADAKGDSIENLEKACWYLKREIETRKSAKTTHNHAAPPVKKDGI